MIPLQDENPTRITPYVTWALIAFNIIIYLMQATGGMVETQAGLRGTLAGLTMIPVEVTQGIDLPINGPTIQPAFLTIFSAMFLHGGLLHLGGNMLFLLIFGNNIEDVLGHAKYLLFYLACGFLAAVTQILMNPASIVPTLGASGAIAGVLGAYVLLFPHARVKSLIFLGFFITVARLPAYVVLGFWIISQFFSQWTHAMQSVGRAESGGVAYVAHIGGFFAGLLLIKLLGGKTPPSYFPGYSQYTAYDPNRRPPSR